MRKVYGIKSLVSYLVERVNDPITEEDIHELIILKKIPHQRPIQGVIVFDLDHIDWWIAQRKNP
jgi:hypothetical protein